MTDAPVVRRRQVEVLRAPHTAFGVLRVGRGVGPEALAAIEQALGQALPRQSSHSAGAQPRALWTAPGEWTLIDAEPSALAALAGASPGMLSHYADLTDGRAGYRLEGPAARRLLAAECPLDLSEAALPPSRCAQSLFAGMPILLDRREGEDGLRLYVDVSLAQHLEAWLLAVAEAMA